MTRKTKTIAVASTKRPKGAAPKQAKSHDVKAAKLRGEIRRLSISNDELLRLAKVNPPPPEFFEGDVEKPW